MKPGRKKGDKGSKSAVVKAYYSGKTFEEALKLSDGLDEHTADLIWACCRRVEEFFYVGASELRHDTGLEKWVADYIFQRNTRKRRREKIEARKNEPSKNAFLTSKMYYRSI